MIGQRWCALASLTLLVLGSAHAELNSAARLKSFAKLPNWGGIWEQFNVAASGRAATAEEGRKWGEAYMQTRPPYNSVWQSALDELVRKRKFESASEPDKPICAFGFPTLMVTSPLMFQAIVTPEETTLVFSQREIRHIFTDGRKQPPKDELWLTLWGHSVGHWEGQTLVVDTVATSSGLFREEQGYNILAPLSADAHFIERIRMIDGNTLENQITFEDPIATTHPWSFTAQYHRVPNMTELVEEDCQGNDRNPVVDGKFTIAPPLK